jgi:dephospho-CoA kinase
MAVVQVGLYRTEWRDEFERLAARLRQALGGLALRVDHIGSTAVPGLPTKDVIDAQVIVASLDDEAELIEAFARMGFSPRPGEWNRRDHIPVGWHGPRSEWAKLVFGPPDGERPANVHVRVHGRANERYALLFRDYLRADGRARQAWGEFKRRVAAEAPDLSAYGRIKDPATDVLVLAAEAWAERVHWSPES